MTGAILGGASVDQAAKLQMVIMFMINAVATLSSISVTAFALSIIVDGEHRVRPDRIDERPHAVYRARSWVAHKIEHSLELVWLSIKHVFSRHKDDGEAGREGNSSGESEGLLGSN